MDAPGSPRPEAARPEPPGPAAARHGAPQHGAPQHGAGGPSRWSARAVGTAALALVAAQLAVRAVVLAVGYFYWDDLILVGRAGTYPLASGDLLLYAHDGHLMPGAFLLAGALTRAAPFVWTLPVLSVLALQALAGAGVWVLLRRLAGPGPAALAPFALFLFAPLTLPSGSWWAAALNALPLQAALAWGSVAALAHARTRSRRSLAGFAAAVAGGLLFFEKAVVVPVVALAVVVLARRVDGAARPVRAALRDGWRAWAAAAVLLAGWAAAYAAVVGDERPATAFDAGQAATLAWRTVSAGLVPALVGGPLEWSRVEQSTPFATPPGWLVVLAWAVVAGAAAAALRRRRRTGWVVAAAAAYAAFDVALLVAGRTAPGVPAELGQTLRYVADAAVVVAVAWALVLRAPRRAPRDGARRAVRVPPAARGPARLLAGTAAAAAALVSTVAYAAAWAQTPPRAYLQTAVASLDGAGGTLLDQPVPQRVLYGLAFPQNQASRVFSALRDVPPFGRSTEALRVLDDDGRLVPGAVAPQRSAVRGPRPDCGWWVDGAAVDVALDQPVVEWEWTVRLGYLADRDAELEVSLGGGPAQRVAVRGGLHDVYVRLDGGGLRLRVRPLTDGLRLCVADGQLGAVVPASLLAAWSGLS